MRLTKDQILSAPDIRTEEVVVPEWDGAVLVRGLSGTQRDQFESKIIEQRGRRQVLHREHVRAWLVALSVVDENGARVFADSDVPALSQKSAGALERIFDVARRLSGMSEADVEELTKNSESDQSGGSGTA
jgi:hypothetical protein